MYFLHIKPHICNTKTIVMRTRSLFILLLCAATIQVCQAQKVGKALSLQTDGHPSWLMQGNIYEVNIRQYTQEGTFNAFAKHLDRLRNMGVQTLWFMPINPISKVDRKGSLGSYYAVANYTAVNPEFGTMADWQQLVQTAHKKGFKVIIDWVPNHTGADHEWLQKKPNFYVKDSLTGKPLSPFDWTDARKLNYQNPELCDSMIASMEFWLKHAGIDGFRCDVAGEVPDAFWTKCIAQLKKGRNIMMLAEGDKPELHQSGFDVTYAWADFAMLKLVAKGDRKANAIDSTLQLVNKTFPKNSLRMFFTSNHDENSWNKADYETMPGASHAPFAVLTQTIQRSIPLIYTGQEEPVLRTIAFFEKDVMEMGKYQRAPFYQKLLHLRMRNAALAGNAAMTRINTSNDGAVYAYARTKGNKKIVVFLNFSKQTVSTVVNSSLLKGTATELFTGKRTTLAAKQPIHLPAWGYLVYEY